MKKHLHIDDFPVRMDLPIQWGDMDAFQHVNNARFFRFFESARIHYFNALNLHDMLTGTNLGPILAKAGCTFIAPLTFPDTITVGSRSVLITPSKIEQEYLMHSHSQDAAAALGTATIVAYDYSNLCRAEFPSHALEKIAAFEGVEVHSPA